MAAVDWHISFTAATTVYVPLVEYHQERRPSDIAPPPGGLAHTDAEALLSQSVASCVG